MTPRSAVLAATLVALAACGNDGAAPPATTATATSVASTDSATTVAPTTTEQATTSTAPPLTVDSLTGKLLIVSVSCDEQDREMNNSPIQQVCVMNADGTGARNLSDPTIDESSAAWSPDGTKIALTSMFDGYNSRLVMMNADGTGRAPVNAGKVGFSGVRWSPDGTQLVMPSLWVGNVDGTRYSADNTYRFVGVDQSANHPDWSPDGTQFAYVSGLYGTPDELYCDALFVVDVDGANPQQITPDPETDVGPCAFDPPEWSPDGSLILFAYSSDTGMNLFVVHPDGTGLRQLTTGQYGGMEGGWSPDGTQIAYMAIVDDVAGLYVMTLDGGQVVQVPAPQGMVNGLTSIDWAA